MRKLTTWLENPFTDKGISVQELSAFTTDHLQKMIAQDTGQFTARITATTNTNQVFEAQFSADLTKLGVRKSSKQAKDAFRAGLPGKMAKIDGALTAQYGANSPVHTECFPQGRSIFNSCSDDTVENHLDTVIAGVTAHVADLGAPLVAEATGYKTAWVAIYDASEGSSGAKTATMATKNAAKAALAQELFLNLLTIAGLNPGQPEKLALFMQESLLRDHPQQPPAPPPT